MRSSSESGVDGDDDGVDDDDDDDDGDDDSFFSQLPRFRPQSPWDEMNSLLVIYSEVHHWSF